MVPLPRELVLLDPPVKLKVVPEQSTHQTSVGSTSFFLSYRRDGLPEA